MTELAYACPLCGERFVHMQGLQAHYLHNHPPDKIIRGFISWLGHNVFVRLYFDATDELSLLPPDQVEGLIEEYLEQRGDAHD